MASNAGPSSLTLNEEQIADLLYCARAGETDDLVAYLDELVPTASPTSASVSDEDKSKFKGQVLEQVHDGSGNGMLHYACANGHEATLSILLPHASLSTLLHLNKSGNTPLHWAGLNGHLGSAKLLVARIEAAATADPTEAARIKAASRELERSRQEIERKKREEAEAERRKVAAEAEAVEAEKKEDGDEGVKKSSEETQPPKKTQKEEEEEEAARSIWDVRNWFGRGPITEAQMNDQEAVVQYLLNHMVGAESGADKGPAAAASAASAASASTAGDDADLQKQTEASLKV